MFDLEHIFKHHPPTLAQTQSYYVIREAAKMFAGVVMVNTPSCADQSAAIRKIREAMMIANSAIALDGRTEIAPAPLPVRP